jgi:hypothetical protein
MLIWTKSQPLCHIKLACISQLRASLSIHIWNHQSLPDVHVESMGSSPFNHFATRLLPSLPHCHENIQEHRLFPSPAIASLKKGSCSLAGPCCCCVWALNLRVNDLFKSLYNVYDLLYVYIIYIYKISIPPKDLISRLSFLTSTSWDIHTWLWFNYRLTIVTSTRQQLNLGKNSPFAIYNFDILEVCEFLNFWTWSKFA